MQADLKRIFKCLMLIVCSGLILACAAIGDNSADIDECRAIAYTSSDDSGHGAVATFDSCMAVKDKQRKEHQRQETMQLWANYFFDLIIDNDEEDY
ncbi:hypothetical protein [Thalassotalea mangrovi]|uniref:DUF3012 domain-containing protein n=1 Tax=Thalassotalea mangrovi TaxID=2572245 RepID=A0A4U1B787_9GAMM|nr:hypothetical protein [Thalassotalea mangrovi]TKB46371.1 hypothetical protein E8M12_04775 [Thalassotalea mangrovi]